MKSSTVPYLLKQAIEITEKLAQIKIKDLATAERVFRNEMHRLTGYLIAVDAVIRHEYSLTIPRNDENIDEKLDYEVKKVQKRLKAWSRKPDQINTKILCCFLKIKHLEKISPVPIDVLKQRFVAERCTWDNMDPIHAEKEFATNFGLMKTVATSNHGKIFDVDANRLVSIWPKAFEAVEAFRNAVRIGL